MGAKARQRPNRLSEKLLQIRSALGLSQDEMISRLNAEDTLTQKRISSYEIGTHEPSIIILLQYARVSGVNMEVLADDELDLPESLPGPTNHEEIKRKFTSRRKARR